LKVEKTEFLSADRTTGFVNIVDVETAHQVKFDLLRLKELFDVLPLLEKMGFEEIYVSLDKDGLIVIGDKKIGFALAPLRE
jgi:hypothetical protein